MASDDTKYKVTVAKYKVTPDLFVEKDKLEVLFKDLNTIGLVGSVISDDPEDIKIRIGYKSGLAYIEAVRWDTISITQKGLTISKRHPDYIEGKLRLTYYI